MNSETQDREFKGTFIFGILMIGVVAVRGITFYWGLSNLILFVILLMLFCIFYSLSLSFIDRLTRFRFLYFSSQTILILVLGNLQPALDVTNLLFITLSLQVVHAYTGRAAICWIILYALLLLTTMILGRGWAEGLTLCLFFLAGGAFVVSYDVLYLQAKENQRESQELLSELQEAHQKLNEYTAQTEELAAARERNRLARELHDSVSQLIFSIVLTAMSAQILLEKEPARVPEQFDLMEEMTSDALNQLRSLIAQLRPSTYPE